MEDIVIQGDIQFTRSTHEYLHLPTKKKLMAVSHVIKTIYNKKSWDGVDEAVIENARDRGKLVDDYLAEYIDMGRVVMANEREDVIERVKIATSLLESNYPGRVKTEAQRIVYNVAEGIAGTADIVIDEALVVDLKSTWQPEVDWILQIGAYAWLGGFQHTSILHVSPRYYKKMKYAFGGRVIRYDKERAVDWWIEALSWWKRSKVLENEFKEKKGIQPG